jgi:hypothetical protein
MGSITVVFYVSGINGCNGSNGWGGGQLPKPVDPNLCYSNDWSQVRFYGSKQLSVFDLLFA